MRLRTLAKTHLAFGLVAGQACAAPARDPEAAAVRRIILTQVARYPRLEPPDLYKLLHQAAMGSEHAMTDTAGVRAWMTREVATMGAGPADPLVDTIAPGGAVVRVNLRPWIAAGRSADSLVAAFIATAEAVPPDTARLLRFLLVADTLAASGDLPFSPEAWRELVATRWRDGFPATHHSTFYEETYRPAYRVVAGPLLP